MYKVVRKLQPNRFNWSEALKTLERMTPGKNLAFFVPVREGDFLSDAGLSLTRVAKEYGILVYVQEQEPRWNKQTPERGLWVWRR